MENKQYIKWDVYERNNEMMVVFGIGEKPIQFFIDGIYLLKKKCLNEISLLYISFDVIVHLLLLSTH